MQFQVPQFIEVESKIFGQMTGKQFAYVAGGFGVFFIIYYFLQNFWLTVITGGPILVFGLVLAFYKINNRPFSFTLEAMIRYLFSSKIYLWKKQSLSQNQTQIINKQGQVVDNKIFIPTSSTGKLDKVGWDLNISSNKSASEGVPVRK